MREVPVRRLQVFFVSVCVRNGEVFVHPTNQLFASTLRQPRAHQTCKKITLVGDRSDLIRYFAVRISGGSQLLFGSSAPLRTQRKLEDRAGLPPAV